MSLEGFDSFIKSSHSPNLQYDYINYKFNQLKDSEEFKLEVFIDFFKDTMQYVEEFSSYFLGHARNENISLNIIKVSNKDIVEFFEDLDNYDENVALKYGVSTVEKLLETIFDLDEINKNNSIQNIFNCISSIYAFISYYTDLYNSIKHGFRIFSYDLDFIELGENIIQLDSPYFCAICKNMGKPYLLFCSLDALFQDSEKILRDTNEIFNFLRKRGKYYNSYSFDYISEKSFSEYNKLICEENLAICVKDIGKINIEKQPQLQYFSMELKQNKLILSLNESFSKGSPYIARLKENYTKNLKPNLNFDFVELSADNIDISQYYILKDIISALDENEEINVNFRGFNDALIVGKYKFHCSVPANFEENLKIVINLQRKIIREM